MSLSKLASTVFDCILYKSMAAIHIVLGFAVLAGGADRFSGITYQPLLVFSNGIVEPYGITYIISGSLIAINSYRTRLLGLGIGVLIHNLWAALFLYAIISIPEAGTTATVAYGGYGLLCAVLFGLTVSRRNECIDKDI